MTSTVKENVVCSSDSDKNTTLTNTAASSQQNSEPYLQNNATVLEAPSFGSVFLKLFFHSVAMFTLPFITYFGIKSYAEYEYDVKGPRNFIYGTIGAVIVVQLIIASYVYQAMKEESENRKLVSSKKES